MLNSFQEGVLVICCVNMIAVLGMSVLTGFTRLFSFGNAGFMSIGAYAAAICSGSSLFMWSATAGFILSDKVNHAKIKNERGENSRWGILQYLKYGLQNYAIQLGIAVICIWLIL